MPHIDPEFIDDARRGEFSPAEFTAWLDDEAHAEAREFIEEALENGLSLEWAAMVCDRDISPDIEAWDHATIMRDDQGEWAVSITDGSGDVQTFTFADEEAAQDLIWADLYFHLTEYGVEFDKDIHSVGGE